MWRFTKHHAVQTYWGNEVAYNYEFLISTPEACERLPLFSVRFIPEDSPPLPNTHRIGGWVHAVVERIILSRWESNPGRPGRKR